MDSRRTAAGRRAAAAGGRSAETPEHNSKQKYVSRQYLDETLGLPGPQRMGISLELAFIPPTFIFKNKK